MIAGEYDKLRWRWRALSDFQHIALQELSEQGVHHGNETTRESLRRLGLIDGEHLSADGLELIEYAYATGLMRRTP